MDYDTPLPRYCAKLLTREKVMIVLDGKTHVVALVDTAQIAKDIFNIVEVAK